MACRIDYAVDPLLHQAMFALLSDVLLSSLLQQHEMVRCHGFVVVGYLLEQVFRHGCHS